MWLRYNGFVDFGYNKHFRVHHSKNEFARGNSHISGIEHYHRQRKNGGGFKLWILIAILVAIVMAVYYYLFDNQEQISTNPKTSLIVVKEPEIDQVQTQVISIPFNSKAITQTETQISEVLENLDEIKSTVQ